MKRFLPDSLFWRMIWVLFFGLLVTQMISMFINYEERDQLLYKTAGSQSAQRITNTVLLLDSLNKIERQRIVNIINIPPQTVTLSDKPILVKTDINIEKNRSLEIAQTAFLALLTDQLGNRNIEVAQKSTTINVPPLRKRDGSGKGYGKRRKQQEEKEEDSDLSRNKHIINDSSGISFLVQVQLLDGQWVVFDTYELKDSSPLPLRLFITLTILFVSVLFISFIAVRWMIRPLKQMASAADALGRDINQKPLPEIGPKEIRQAAHAFNLMQLRLKHFIQDRAHIFAAMSHDLKTPITRLRLRTELLDDEAVRDHFEQDLKEMELMVTEALDFMKGLDTKQQRQPVSIMALLESLQEDYLETGKIITIEGKANQPFMSFAPLLKRCLMNLLDNAIFYGQQAHITIEDNDDFLVLRIKDKGPGISLEEQEKAFEPFYRLESSRSRETGGTGLGLTIARNIIQTHGGDISLNNHPHGGLEVIVVLPRKK